MSDITPAPNLAAQLKQRARRLVDRIALPYVDSVADRVAERRGEGAAAAPVPDPDASAPSLAPVEHGTSDYFHIALHELRTMQLESVPKGAHVALSVGAQGRWYFDWFERAVGVLDEHVGVEAYEPMPDDLPLYARWVADTADHMVGVPDASVDLVFAGQTSEHLWAGELAGFLTESHRVLRAGGILALDSPNRVVTEHLNWSHGGHTIELSVGEMSELLALAGFEVLTTAGLWGCVVDGRVLQLEEGIENPATFARRCAGGSEHPDESFVWWINARRLQTDPQTAELAKRIDDLFELHWNTRVCRSLGSSPAATSLALGATSSGKLGETMPFPLHEGSWTITATLIEGSWSDVQGFRIDIVVPGGERFHSVHMDHAAVTGPAASWTVEQPYLVFALALQLWVDSVDAPAVLQLPLDIRLS